MPKNYGNYSYPANWAFKAGIQAEEDTERIVLKENNWWMIIGLGTGIAIAAIILYERR